MSPRTDSYLSLCLEQASKSSLHYRHGCIVVRGGKVIGQGYNDHRPGFSGVVTLKSGRLGNGATNSPALMALKLRNPKSKSKSKSKSKQSYYGESPVVMDLASTDISELGGGCLAKSPLSMHSEMMAIQSALSLSSNTASYGSARSSALLQKPGLFKLSSRDKRELRLRNLKSYVDTVCGEALAAKASKTAAGMQYGGESQNNQDSNNKKEEEKNERDAPQFTVKSTPLDRKKHQYAHHREHELHREVHNHPEHMAQQQQAQHELFQTSLGPANNDSPNDPNPRLAVGMDQTRHMATTTQSVPKLQSLHQKSHRKNEPARNHLKSSPTTLVPQGLPTASSQKIRERTKDPRLKGSDLYVARLCWKETSTNSQKLSHEAVKLNPTNSSNTPTTPSSTGSLHDELRAHHESQTNPPFQPEQSPPQKQPTATQSRPCYRCISYMHSAGIERVFWTNAKGEWEGAKVQQLVDALECGGDGDGDGDEGKVSSLFVTKHEVLMLKRTMESHGR